MACKFRLSRFCNVERSDREYLRAPPPGRWIEGGNGYRREPRTRNVNSRHVPRSDELIWKFQSALRTNESRRRKISQAPLALLSLSYTIEARGWREDRRVALASPRLADLLPLFIPSLRPPLPTCQKARSFVFLLCVASFDRTFAPRFFEHSAGFYGRTFRPEIEVARPWLYG